LNEKTDFLHFLCVVHHFILVLSDLKFHFDFLVQGLGPVMIFLAIFVFFFLLPLKAILGCCLFSHHEPILFYRQRIVLLADFSSRAIWFSLLTPKQKATALPVFDFCEPLFPVHWM
jgi:hypothetical protein